MYWEHRVPWDLRDACIPVAFERELSIQLAGATQSAVRAFWYECYQHLNDVIVTVNQEVQDGLR